VLNLTGEHRGTLNVNRRELLAYDTEWMAENWARGAQELPEWPELTLEWLWLLESESLPAARTVWDQWSGKGIRVRSEDDGSVHDLDELGWCAHDRSVITHVRSPMAPHGDLERYGPWRSAALGGQGGRLSATAPRSLVGHPVPQPGDAGISRAADRYWASVIAHAAEHGFPVAHVIGRQRRLRVVHPKEGPPPTVGGDLDWIPDDIDLAIAHAFTMPDESVARLFGVVPSDLHTRERLFSGMDDRGRLVITSAQLGMTLGELALRLARYRHLGAIPVPHVPEHHADTVCTADDLNQLFRIQGRGYSQRIRRVELPSEVARAIHRSSAEPAHVLECLARFSWLGWEAPPAAEVAKWTALDDGVVGLLRTFSRRRQDGQSELSWGAVVDYA
ncbi:hypothetical protein ACFVZ1_23665, partial [Bacillus subtilis]